jgi:hypothetical protein
MTRSKHGRATGLAVGVGAALAALLLAGCGGSGGGGDAGWQEPDDYSYTLELFDGPCGGSGSGTGAWAITVEAGEATAAEPQDEAARESSWAEGAPTIGEVLSNALGVRADGAYDRVDIDYAQDGRPTRVHYVDRDSGDGAGGYEGCERISGYRAAD